MTIIIAFFSPDTTILALVNYVNPVLGSAMIVVHHCLSVLKDLFVLRQKSLGTGSKLLSYYQPKVLRMVFLALGNGLFVDLVPTVPHLSHNQPELPAEFGYPGVSLVLLPDIGEVCLLVVC